MQILEESSFNLKHGTVAYRRSGNSAGRTIIAFHGWLDNLCSFDQLTALCPQYCWLTIDLPGHGLSEHPPQGMRTHWVDYIDIFHALFNEIGPGPHHVLGHSLGAGLCSLYAAMFPEQVASLVLIDMIGPLVWDPEKAATRLRESVLSYANLDESRISTYPDIEAALKARQAATPLPEERLRAMVQRNLIKKQPGWQWRTDKRLLCPPAMGMTEIEVQSFLSRLTAPVLFIAPEQGLVLNHPIIRERLRQVKSLSLEKISGGHHVHMEYPEHVAPLINAFLEHA